MRKAVILTLAIVGAIITSAGPTARAASTTATRLQITPKVCVVDVVQDGNNQTVQTPSGAGDCTVALPILLDSTKQGGEGGFCSALPFAGTESGTNQLFRSQSGGTLSAIAARHPETSPTTRGTDQSGVLIAALVAMGTAMIVAIDVALFDLHYSKTVARWTRDQTTGRVLKR
jgi:hypothetical protein